MKNYYDILGLNIDCDSTDIKIAFRHLAKKHHPDLNNSESSSEIFQDIYEAYSVLKDEEKRKLYGELRKHKSGEKQIPKEEYDKKKSIFNEWLDAIFEDGYKITPKNLKNILFFSFFAYIKVGFSVMMKIIPSLH